MNEEQKKLYKEKYSQEKQKGVKFWPDIIYKDVVITLALFIVLDHPGNLGRCCSGTKSRPLGFSLYPTSGVVFPVPLPNAKVFPRRRWNGLVPPSIPIIAVLVLFLLPFFDRNPNRYWKSRPWAIGIMAVMVVGIVVLTILAAVSTPPQEVTGTMAGPSEQILAGQDLYSVQLYRMPWSER